MNIFGIFRRKQPLKTVEAIVEPEVVESVSSITPAKPVICITTGEEFPSITAAAKHFGVSRDTMRKHINNSKYADKRFNGMEFKFK